MSFLEIVFVGWCGVFVCLEFVEIFFFPLAAKLIGPFQGCEFFKKVDFFDVAPLQKISYIEGDGGDNFGRVV